MIILGIDPGSRKTGFGLIEKSGNHVSHLENGTFYLEDKDSFAERLVFLHEKIKTVITSFKPKAIVVENIFYHKNPKSLQKLGEVRGVVILSGALLGLEVFEYTPLEVKKTITGHGVATKEQVQYMVRRLLKLKDLAEENASDALALAWCHAQTNNSLAKLLKNTKANVSRAKSLLEGASFYR